MYFAPFCGHIKFFTDENSTDISLFSEFGLIAIYFAQRFPELVNGIVASSPALGMIIEVPAAKKILGSLMSFLWPSLTMGNELDADRISHDSNVVSAYENDPLVHDRVSSRFFTELLAAMETVNRQASSLRVPILMQVAGDDHLVNARISHHQTFALTLHLLLSYSLSGPSQPSTREWTTSPSARSKRGYSSNGYDWSRHFSLIKS